VFDNRDSGLSEKFTASGVPDLKAVAAGATSAPYDLGDMAGDVVGLMDHLEIEVRRRCCRRATGRCPPTPLPG